ncbi:hypothetical protein E4T42_02196 [Aureobasidium subglaciale]|uniref:Uncharacterized protein n=1 Tax=Aureobasidium subglaciale (strain EXF-2481) TaxID=1043005 RepID=A0A074YKJ6_AURSE|nr:uncharacterized protein AUEXF2481DRAFT_5487 [Aureobasidium subglaciale EXF-2481]KAI5212522.1 hypothetical protein E4T38_00339 [Aureobasidium subglaciale]KAI5231638.1 hypothetical protein E4T40_00566 [Aureobasidium subglaciale]KAI5234472.1 hypothetical protein E4T41_00338 [Aureobasidium subglaciale]KAI5254893.1 hypothetical protein E4T42_02196 [Aureobasidium subglaciale]KAI5268022.1 hypothetical protein E4T46_00338 [Aureobasidium subglaciale]
MTSVQDLSAWDKDGRVFLFTSLTAGSSHIITATSRIETILNANRIPFMAIDTATNELARRLFGRRSGGKKLPALVKEGYVIADLDEVEEWNEFGEIKENIGDVPPSSSALPPGGEAVTTRATMHSTTQPPAQLPVKPTTTAATKSAHEKTESLQSPMANLSMKEAASQAATIGAARKGPTPGINDTKVAPLKLSLADADTQPETMNSSANTKSEGVKVAEDTAAQASKASESPAEPSSAPLSAVESNDEQFVTVTPAGSIQQKHRGSSISIANPEEIKELEQSSAIPEADEEDEEQPKTQDQEAAAAEKASVSVQD